MSTDSAPDGATLMKTPGRGGYATSPRGRIYFEVFGPENAPPLMLMNPGTSRGLEPEMHRAYRDALAPAFQIIFYDYPVTYGGSERSPSAPPMTPDMVAAEFIAVADAAGVDRFAYHGYSFGGNSGLQLAARHSDRLTALIIGGWPVLGGDFRRLLDAGRAMIDARESGSADPNFGRMDDVKSKSIRDAADDYVAYYECLQNWDEAGLARELRMPRLNFADAADDIIGTGIGSALIGSEAELRSMGWETLIVRTGAPPEAVHSAAMQADVVVPILCEFLRRVL